MSKLINLAGKRFNDLVVLRRAIEREDGVPVWECQCDCGNITYVRGNNLKSGAVKSCGCRKKNTKSTLTHGMSHTRLYARWTGMRNRCYLSTIKSYKDYGGRGITVCDSWKNSFEAFAEWAINNGYSDSLSLERKDTNGNYCPENCTWIPLSKQPGNRRMCRKFEHNGKVQNLTEWCKELHLPYKQVHNRISKLNWSFERAISEPVHIEKRNKVNV